ncbi:hypothetical protein DFH29DRAFT_878909 [Suillus ampliporus]|nr:hypothetical protein DFH29DRAFT_878909 [Suillus ampliporus]
MAPWRWTTSEELEWLQNELPEFLKMQKDQRLTRFYELLYPRWFSQFPEHFNYWKPTGNPLREGEGLVCQNDDSGDANSDESSLLPLTPEQEAELEGANEIRQKKLREWFRNNGKSKTTPGNTSTSKAFAHLLGQRACGVRDLKEIEVYSKIYYKTKIQPLVQDDIQENQLDPKKRIGIVQKYTNSCFAAESEEVKGKIREETARINASRRLGGIVSDKRTKEEIYRAIQELPMVLGQICEDLAALTGGWHYTLIMGGPDPMCQGDIMTLSFHHGKGQDGLSFKASNPNFHEQYLAPFEKHLRTVFGHIDRPSAESSSSSSIPNPYLPAPSDSASPELPVSVEANSDLNADPEFSGTHVFPHDSLMDPDFSVSEADIDAFITSICPLTADGPNGRWWHSQSQDMQMAAPPLVNSPPAAGSLIESPMPGQNSLLVGASSTPPRIRRPRSNAIPTSLTMSPQLPPVDTLHTANSEGDSLPVTPISQSTPAAVVSNASVAANTTLLPVLDHSTPATANSDSLPPVSGISALLTDTTSIPTTPDTLLPVGSIPPVSSGPGRHSVRMARPSTRAEDANKIGNNAKTITSKRKRKVHMPQYSNAFVSYL